VSTPTALADLPIRPNTILLAASMAVLSATLQLVAAVASLTFVLVSGIAGLLGLGPAIFLASVGVSAQVAGRLMDRLGRRPVIAAGFVVAAIGAVVTGLGARAVSTIVVIGGFVLVGAGAGAVNLVRTAGGDMYPPERRARGIAYVLSGAVFGAVLGPAVFGPIFAGRHPAPEEMTVPWLAAGGLMLVGLVLVLMVRPDPLEIAKLMAPPEPDGEPPARAAPLRELIGRPGVLASLLAAVASFAVMASVMNLTGFVVVEHHNHEQSDVFPIIGAHVLGMYALVLVVGSLIDRIGRPPALVGGLLVMGVSCALLFAVDGVVATAILLFGLGVGWNLSFVAANAELVDRTRPIERGKLLGFSEALSALSAAALALIGGVVLNELGVTALAFGAAFLVVVPIVLIGRIRRRPTLPVPADAEALM
jgi:MFS family permease